MGLESTPQNYWGAPNLKTLRGLLNYLLLFFSHLGERVLL